ncbi:MAG TPA: ATP-binding protein, partial [Ktedonobacterales bacterium]|nr:ATP-binding protein [Ktedonobacterales bacterium]
DAQVLGIAPVALLAVPLVTGGEVAGVLEVGYGPNTPGPDATSLDLVQTLAAAAAAAMANVRLYRQLRDARDGFIATQEGERRRLAGELRDGPAQQVGQLALALEYAEQLARHDPRQVPGELRRLREQTVGIAADLRRLQMALRPLVRDTRPDGLVPALERYLERFTGGTGPQMHLRAEYSDRLSSEVETAVFVVVQEAVANVLQHAQAHNCWIELSETPERLVVTVRDDGAGFDARQVQQEYETRGGLGLVNMLERAAQVGGKLTIASQPDRGTVTSLDVPR